MPGPNDYHIRKGGELEPGLGKDELSEAQRAALRSRGGDKLAKLKEQMELEAAQLSEKEKELAEAQDALALREREIEAREQALAARESEKDVDKDPDE